jgi:hypothetical protein
MLKSPSLYGIGVDYQHEGELAQKCADIVHSSRKMSSDQIRVGDWAIPEYGARTDSFILLCDIRIDGNIQSTFEANDVDAGVGKGVCHVE